MALMGSLTTSSAVSTTTASSVFFSGSNVLQVEAGEARITCRKDGIHPKYFPEAKVYCKGDHVMSVGGTQAEYVVDVWSGNHPFFQGNKSALLLDADRVDKFKQRYGNLSTLNDIPVLTQGEIIFEKRKKGKGKGKK